MGRERNCVDFRYAYARAFVLSNSACVDESMCTIAHIFLVEVLNSQFHAFIFAYVPKEQRRFATSAVSPRDEPAVRAGARLHCRIR